MDDRMQSIDRRLFLGAGASTLMALPALALPALAQQGAGEAAKPSELKAERIQAGRRRRGQAPGPGRRRLRGGLRPQGCAPRRDRPRPGRLHGYGRGDAGGLPPGGLHHPVRHGAARRQCALGLDRGPVAAGLPAAGRARQRGGGARHGLRFDLCGRPSRLRGHSGGPAGGRDHRRDAGRGDGGDHRGLRGGVAGGTLELPGVQRRRLAHGRHHRGDRGGGRLRPIAEGPGRADSRTSSASRPRWRAGSASTSAA